MFIFIMLFLSKRRKTGANNYLNLWGLYIFW